MSTPPRDHIGPNEAVTEAPVTSGDLGRWRRNDVPPDLSAIIRAGAEAREASSQQTTKIPAVLYHIRTGEILGVAANVFAPGLAMSNEEMRRDRDRKDKSIGHAEETVLDDYSRKVLRGEAKPYPPEELGIWVEKFCCPRCARKISRQGLGEVIADTSSLDIGERFARNWASDIMLGKEILDSRPAELGGPVRIRLVEMDADPALADQGKFRWADPTRDYFDGVREHAALQRLGKAGYLPPTTYGSERKAISAANDLDDEQPTSEAQGPQIGRKP